MDAPELHGPVVSLRPLRAEDVSERYVGWMRDSDVTKYLESRFSTFTLRQLKDYVEEEYRGDAGVLFGIYDLEYRQHIGNIKLGPIDHNHRFASVGLLIGESGWRGRGVATEAISLVVDYAFEDLRLNKLIAGMYEPNVASYRAFLACGFVEAGRLRRHRLYDGNFVDEIRMERCRDY